MDPIESGSPAAVVTEAEEKALHETSDERAMINEALANNARPVNKADDDRQQRADRLKSLRLSTGLTQSQFGRMVNDVGQQAVSDWEVGDDLPGIESLRGLAELFGVGPARMARHILHGGPAPGMGIDGPRDSYACNPRDSMPGRDAVIFGETYRVHGTAEEQAAEEARLRQHILRQHCQGLRVPLSGCGDLDELIWQSRLADLVAGGDSVQGAASRLESLGWQRPPGTS